MKGVHTKDLRVKSSQVTGLVRGVDTDGDNVLLPFPVLIMGRWPAVSCGSVKVSACTRPGHREHKFKERRNTEGNEEHRSNTNYLTHKKTSDS